MRGVTERLTGGFRYRVVPKRERASEGAYRGCKGDVGSTESTKLYRDAV